MDTDLVKNIITLIVASIPLIVLIATFLLNRTGRTNQPLDSPSLKVFTLVHFPIDAKQWEVAVNRNSISKFKIITLGLVVYASLLMPSRFLCNCIQMFLILENRLSPLHFLVTILPCVIVSLFAVFLM